MHLQFSFSGKPFFLKKKNFIYFPHKSIQNIYSNFICVLLFSELRLFNTLSGFSISFIIVKMF